MSVGLAEVTQEPERTHGLREDVFQVQMSRFRHL